MGTGPLIAYGIFCILFAFFNYIQIEKVNEQVRHGINGIFHIVTCLYFSFAIGWMMGAALLLEGRLVFDTSLNLFRGRSIGYVPENPKSIVDKVEKWVFRGDGILPKIFYLILFLFLLIKLV